MIHFDTIIRGGTIIDGTGIPGFQKDLGIKQDRICAIEDLSKANSFQTIDATGLIVSPGFIDIHSHSDRTLVDDGGAESKIHQGVTTEVVGNCSFSSFPVATDGGVLISRSHRSNVEYDWTDLDGFSEFLEKKGISVNIAHQLGHSALREAVGLLDKRPPNPDELYSMKRLAVESVEQGAFSLTTGLTLVPSCYAKTEEIIEIAKAIAQFPGCFYATHARLWANMHVEAVEEALRVGLEANLPVQYSHMAIIDSRLFDNPEVMLKPFEKAITQGQDVTYDMYPYIAAGTHLSQMLPEWVQEGGINKMLIRIRNPIFRKKTLASLKLGWFKGLPWDWGKIIISFVNSRKNTSLVGKTIEDIAIEWKREPEDVFLQLIDKENNQVGCIMINRREDNIQYFMNQPYAMFGSDGNAISKSGIYSHDKPHPRFYGCYPRIFGHYVREESVLSLEEAVYKSTGFPSWRMGFKKRGTLKVNNYADIIIWNPDTIIDKSTFQDPHHYAEGIIYVWVNGIQVVKDGQHTGERPGRVIRRGNNN